MKRLKHGFLLLLRQSDEPNVVFRARDGRDEELTLLTVGQKTDESPDDAASGLTAGLEGLVGCGAELTYGHEGDLVGDRVLADFDSSAHDVSFRGVLHKEFL